MNLERYSRQTLFAGIGEDGQNRLKHSHVVIIGCGALGAMQAEMLARAGVGRLRLVDRDFIEESNLQRQIMFEERDVLERLPKSIAAESRINRINSTIAVEAIVKDVDYSNIEDLIGDADLVLDGTDNFETRFLLNDVCLKAGIPWVYGACVGSYGLALLVRPHVSPCLRCVLEEMPGPGGPTCDTVGVVAPVVHVVAGLQAGEALKMLAGRAQDLLPGVVTVDLWKGRFEVMDLGGRAPWCPACTEGRYDYLESGTGTGSAVLCGRDAVQVRPPRGTRVDLPALAGRLSASGDVAANEHLVRFRAAGTEMVVFGDGRAIVKGVKDAAQARSLYARYVGS
jgi:molybdopterin-synthase adenylyltransferase